MTIADDLRAAAREILKVTPSLPDDGTCDCDYCAHLKRDPNRQLITRLRAHADTIERVEREIDAACAVPQELSIDDLHDWLESLRGDSNGK